MYDYTSTSEIIDWSRNGNLKTYRSEKWNLTRWDFVQGDKTGRTPFTFLINIFLDSLFYNLYKHSSNFHFI